MPGPHYAISEAFIVLVAIWCVLRLSQSGLWLVALGIAVFGFAAAIGVYRFGTNQIVELASFHKNVSQIGGFIAMALVSAQLLLAEPMVNRARTGRWLVLISVIVSGAMAFAIPMLTTPLFIAWLLTAIISAALIPASTIGDRISLAAIVSIFLINLLMVRQSPQLSPGLSWHLFHILVAVWMLGMIYVFEYHRSDDEISKH